MIVGSAQEKPKDSGSQTTGDGVPNSVERIRSQKAVLGVALHQPQHRGEGATSLLASLLDGPEPGTVDVRVADRGNGRLVGCGLAPGEPVLHKLVGASQAGAVLGAAWA